MEEEERVERRKKKRERGKKKKDWRRWWSPGLFWSSSFRTFRRQRWAGNYNSHDALTRGSCEREAFPHNPLRYPRMVAPSGAMSDSESSSSGSSDAEELARCREAATPAWGLEQRPGTAEKPEAGRGLPAAGAGAPPLGPETDVWWGASHCVLTFWRSFLGGASETIGASHRGQRVIALFPWRQLRHLNAS